MLITSKDNRSVKLLSKLLSSKKTRNENRLFVIEGMRGCIDALTEHFSGNLKVGSLFYTEKAIENYKDSFPVELLEKFDEQRKFQITQELADRISGNGSCQGVFAVAVMPDIPFEPENISETGKYVILDRLQDPGNVGTLLRTADALGASGVILTNNCCDLYNPKTVRSAVGSIARAKIFVEDDFAKVCQALKNAGITLFASLVGEGESVTKQDLSVPCAVVIGNEGSGLTSEHADMCDKKITIKMKGNANSLNAAAAGAIILWEMFRDQTY